MYGGCLPLIVQMPFIYALYGAFLTVIHAAPLAFPKNVVALNNDLYSFVPHLTSFPQTQFLWTSLVHARSAAHSASVGGAADLHSVADGDAGAQTAPAG